MVGLAALSREFRVLDVQRRLLKPNQFIRSSPKQPPERCHMNRFLLQRSTRREEGIVAPFNLSWCLPVPSELYALASSFSSALPLRNHGRSRRCIYLGSVRFFASSF